MRSRRLSGLKYSRRPASSGAQSLAFISVHAHCGSPRPSQAVSTQIMSASSTREAKPDA